MLKCLEVAKQQNTTSKKVKRECYKHYSYIFHFNMFVLRKTIIFNNSLVKITIRLSLL